MDGIPTQQYINESYMKLRKLISDSIKTIEDRAKAKDSSDETQTGRIENSPQNMIKPFSDLKSRSDSPTIGITNVKTFFNTSEIGSHKRQPNLTNDTQLDNTKLSVEENPVQFELDKGTHGSPQLATKSQLLNSRRETQNKMRTTRCSSVGNSAPARQRKSMPCKKKANPDSESSSDDAYTRTVKETLINKYEHTREVVSPALTESNTDETEQVEPVEGLIEAGEGEEAEQPEEPAVEEHHPQNDEAEQRPRNTIESRPPWTPRPYMSSLPESRQPTRVKSEDRWPPVKLPKVPPHLPYKKLSACVLNRERNMTFRKQQLWEISRMNNHLDKSLAKIKERKGPNPEFFNLKMRKPTSRATLSALQRKSKDETPKDEKLQKPDLNIDRNSQTPYNAETEESDENKWDFSDEEDSSTGHDGSDYEGPSDDDNNDHAGGMIAI